MEGARSLADSLRWWLVILYHGAGVFAGEESVSEVEARTADSDIVASLSQAPILIGLMNHGSADGSNMGIIVLARKHNDVICVVSSLLSSAYSGNRNPKPYINPGLVRVTT